MRRTTEVSLLNRNTQDFTQRARTATRRHLARRLVPMLTVGGSAACTNPFSSGDCVALGVAGVSANMVDAATKRSPASPPTMRLTEGTYVENDTGVLGGADAVRLSGAVERPGRYHALYEANGYQPLLRENLVVRRSGKCNYLQPVSLNIELVRSNE